MTARWESPRAWVRNVTLCKNCGHPRHRHGGNIGKGRFGKSVFCVHRELVAVSYPGLILTGAGATLGHPEKVYRTCGCKTFESKVADE